MSDLPPPPSSGASTPPPPTSGFAPPESPLRPGAPVQYGRGGVVPERLGGAYYSAGLVILLSIVTFSIWTFLWVWRTADDLQKYNGDGLGPGISLLLRFVFWPALLFTMPNEINNMYERDGRESPVNVWWGLWVLLPLIGWIIWYVKVQRALNDFWLSKGAQPG